MAEFGWPCCFQCLMILASSSAVIGTERTLPLLVPLKVITPTRRPVGFSFSASGHRAPVARQIRAMISTVRAITAAPALFQQLGDLFGGQPGQLPFLYLEQLHQGERVGISVPGNAPTQVR